MMRYGRSFSLALALTAAAFASPHAAGNHGGGHGHVPDIGERGDPADVGREIVVTMTDNYYDIETLTVAPGETVRLIIKNEGELLHEFNIGTPHMHDEHQREMAMMMEHGMLEPDRINHEMMKMDMGSGHTMEHDDPNSVLLEPGQQAELVWTFPEGGELEFACNIPGHYESGMVGTIRLQKGS